MTTTPLEPASRPHVPVEHAHSAVSSYADNPSAFLALNTGNRWFAQSDLNGVIAYRESGRYLVQFGGPFAPHADYRDLLGRFADFAKDAGKRVVSVGLQRADALAYADMGFTVNQIGASYAVELGSFTLRGSRFVRLRNKISRARRSGITVAEAAYPPLRDAITAVDAQWLRSKGRHAKQLEFLVGQHGGPMQRCRRLFVALGESGDLIGYVSYSPVPGSRPGWLYDLSRRRPDAPPGVMEAINAHAIEVFGAERTSWLHFGFTPFTGLDTRLETGTSSGWLRWLIRQLAERGAAVYPARSQLAYKTKWAPQAVLPEYLAFPGAASPSGFLRVFKVANAL